MKNILVSSVCLFLVACSTNHKPNIHSYGELDRSEKTITVDAGNRGLNGSIKRELHKRGWMLKVVDNPNSTKTRYTMGVEYWNEYGYCINTSGEDESLLGYDISITDNKTDNEVLTMDGKGCREEITNYLVNAIEGS